MIVCLGLFSWSSLEPHEKRNPIFHYTYDQNLKKKGKKKTVRGIDPCLHESETKKNEPDLTF